MLLAVYSAEVVTAQLSYHCLTRCRQEVIERLQQKLHKSHLMCTQSVNLEGKFAASLLQGCLERFLPSSPGWGWGP